MVKTCLVIGKDWEIGIRGAHICAILRPHHYRLLDVVGDESEVDVHLHIEHVDRNAAEHLDHVQGDGSHETRCSEPGVGLHRHREEDPVPRLLRFSGERCDRTAFERYLPLSGSRAHLEQELAARLCICEILNQPQRTAVVLGDVSSDEPYLGTGHGLGHLDGDVVLAHNAALLVVEDHGGLHLVDAGEVPHRHRDGGLYTVDGPLVFVLCRLGRNGDILSENRSALGEHIEPRVPDDDVLRHSYRERTVVSSGIALQEREPLDESVSVRPAVPCPEDGHDHAFVQDDGVHRDVEVVERRDVADRVPVAGLRIVIEAAVAGDLGRGRVERDLRCPLRGLLENQIPDDVERQLLRTGCGVAVYVSVQDQFGTDDAQHIRLLYGQHAAALDEVLDPYRGVPADRAVVPCAEHVTGYRESSGVHPAEIV